MKIASVLGLQINALIQYSKKSVYENTSVYLAKKVKTLGRIKSSKVLNDVKL